MKPFLISLTISLISSSVLLSPVFTNRGTAQELPRLIQGMPYEQAREMLIKKGWQAAQQNPTQKEETQRQLQRWFLDRGMTEVEECAGTGLGTCRAIFRGDSGETLVLFTTSGSYGDQAPVKVRRWRFE
jgi:hypothetical protein